jgi:hypothetical protein
MNKPSLEEYIKESLYNYSIGLKAMPEPNNETAYYKYLDKLTKKYTQAILGAVKSCVPEKKKMKAIVNGVDVSDKHKISSIAIGYNQAIDDFNKGIGVCMRTIKFRVWNGETMISPDYIDRDGNAHWKENSIPQTSDKIMQFCGLKDKNGKEIYEGDIVQLGGLGSMVVVEWFSDDENVGFNLSTDFEYEVIGNIYENKELLK